MLKLREITQFFWDGAAQIIIWECNIHDLPGSIARDSKKMALLSIRNIPSLIIRPTLAASPLPEDVEDHSFIEKITLFVVAQVRAKSLSRTFVAGVNTLLRDCIDWTGYRSTAITTRYIGFVLEEIFIEIEFA